MKIATSTSQLQKLILAPSMQQSIAILMLPLNELVTTIEQELQENPLLESYEYSAEEESNVLKQP